ncbi:MAG: pyridoxamine 5'-phosphate oxidase [Spirosomataceae bacterium]
MPNEINIADLRQTYTRNELLEKNVSKNPFETFHVWFEEAVKSGILEPNAMVLSTIEHQMPSSRVVLLKALDATGFVFYTNYESHKGQQLVQNPFASLTFFWDKLERQVRVQGSVEFVSADESDAYFQSRPRGSQLGAWVSAQSTEIPDRTTLEERLKELELQYADETIPIPRPPHWGGIRILPLKIEFWQGRPNRLHDRLLYQKTENNWQITRLSP